LFEISYSAVIQVTFENGEISSRLASLEFATAGMFEKYLSLMR
jgi:hypothetical protein